MVLGALDTVPMFDQAKALVEGLVRGWSGL